MHASYLRLCVVTLASNFSYCYEASFLVPLHVINSSNPLAISVTTSLTMSPHNIPNNVCIVVYTNPQLMGWM